MTRACHDGGETQFKKPLGEGRMDLYADEVMITASKPGPHKHKH
jgi:hypothetical protein